MRRPGLLAVLMFAAGGLAGPAEAQEGGSATPNVVLILADDLGWGDVSAMHPASAIRTPHIDRLADEGMRFVDAHSPSGVCTPTRYALLTGRYTWRTRLTRGVLGGYSPPLLEPDRPTLGTLLQAQGFRTAAIGKWHLGMDMPYRDAASERAEPWEGDPGIDFGGVIADSPVHHGFDEYFGVSASLDMAPYVYIRNESGAVERWWSCRRLPASTARRWLRPTRPARRSTRCWAKGCGRSLGATAWTCWSAPPGRP